ncbi:MAG: glycosyltransferase family 2 protein [Desulfobulbaceae bacterium]|nr:glycosyltransferase family 2 protein [Desulfobulbaceae bacterium]
MLATIIVTHDSQQVLPRCIESLRNQTAAVDKIILVDSGSRDNSYLDEYEHHGPVQVFKTGNIGFSAANNYGFQQIPSACRFIFFLNPDTFLEQGCISAALETMRQYPEAGLLTGKLYGFDTDTGEPSGRLDSTGIFRTWYGRWYDRGQGRADTGKYDGLECDIPAVCGAFMFCRRAALEDAALKDNEIFDSDFFLYKEDIELSLRLRKKGWRLLYQPLCIAWHGRGWKSSRRGIPKQIREMAARNEVLLYTKHRSSYMLWAVIKLWLVRVFNI